MQPYTDKFFQQMRADASGSAEVIVPLVLDWVQPRSVVDVGCGTGTWLAMFLKLGVQDVLGVDGDYVDRAMLEIPADRFLPRDLSAPLRLDREFDLVLSLEVAEHLPASSADTFVDSLTRAGPVVLFSAAIPHQGGTSHVNEQWPEYWAELFRRRGYDVYDCVRGRVWHDPRVCYYYAQNALLFVRRGYAGPAEDASHSLRLPQSGGLRDGCPAPLSIVHPHAYVTAAEAADRLRRMAHELSELVPAAEPFILVDLEAFRTLVAAGSRAIPFMERGGEYWGMPADDEAAIHEVERQRAAGVRLIVFLWSAFWCLDDYPAFAAYLRSRFPCVLHSEDLVAFDLTGEGIAVGEPSGPRGETSDA